MIFLLIFVSVSLIIFFSVQPTPFCCGIARRLAFVCVVLDIVRYSTCSSAYELVQYVAMKLAF